MDLHEKNHAPTCSDFLDVKNHHLALFESWKWQKCDDRVVDLARFIKPPNPGNSPIFGSIGTICGGLFPKMYRGQICNLGWCSKQISSCLMFTSVRVEGRIAIHFSLTSKVLGGFPKRYVGVTSCTVRRSFTQNSWSFLKHSLTKNERNACHTYNRTSSAIWFWAIFGGYHAMWHTILPSTLAARVFRSTWGYHHPKGPWPPGADISSLDSPKSFEMTNYKGTRLFSNTNLWTGQNLSKSVVFCGKHWTLDISHWSSIFTKQHTSRGLLLVKDLPGGPSINLHAMDATQRLATKETRKSQRTALVL